MLNKIKDSYGAKVVSIFTFSTLISSAFIISFVAIATRFGMKINELSSVMFTVILLSAIIIIGTIVSIFLSKLIAKHQIMMEKIIKSVSSGNFDVKMPNQHGIIPTKDIANDINKLIDELKNVKILRSDFLSNFSHEFKTPIVSINGFSELLLNDKTLSESEKEEYLKIIYEESSRLAKLSNNMLLLSNLESTAIVDNKTNFLLDEQIKSALKLLETGIKTKNIEVDCSLTTAEYFGNMDMFQQVWINLISNAIKYTDDNGKIKITLIKRKDKIIFSIKNNGTIIEKKDAEHIFDKFYQVDKSHKTSGSGLGLPIVKQIITLHGGTITVKNDKNEWTEFIIIL